MKQLKLRFEDTYDWDFIVPSWWNHPEIERWEQSDEMDEDTDFSSCGYKYCPSWDVMKDRCTCMRRQFRSLSSKEKYTENLTDKMFVRLVGAMIIVPEEGEENDND